MFHVVLYRPEIPPNAGNAIRLAANTGIELHFIEPLGFSLEDRQLRRAGLDYHDLARLRVHRDWGACRAALPGRVFAFTTQAARLYTEERYREGDAFVFGQETAGLPEELLREFPCLRIPMRPGNRSVNLSNAVAIVVFEAWRQISFSGSA